MSTAALVGLLVVAYLLGLITHQIIELGKLARWWKDYDKRKPSTPT